MKFLPFHWAASYQEHWAISKYNHQLYISGKFSLTKFISRRLNILTREDHGNLFTKFSNIVISKQFPNISNWWTTWLQIIHRGSDSDGLDTG